jgi:hypothetical protein
MKHLGGIGVAWFMLSGYLGLHIMVVKTMVCGGDLS